MISRTLTKRTLKVKRWSENEYKILIAADCTEKYLTFVQPSLPSQPIDFVIHQFGLTCLDYPSPKNQTIFLRQFSLFQNAKVFHRLQDAHVQPTFFKNCVKCILIKIINNEEGQIDKNNTGK